VDSKKYIGMDVHQASISMAVADSTGKFVMESVIETKAATILEFIRGLRGTLWVAFEEGTSAAWLYDLLKPHVAQVMVCDPRKNALLKVGNKNDRVDARKLSELLRAGLLSRVYHGEGECGVRTLRELARSYLTVTKDLTRVMNRLKGVYRSWADSLRGPKSLFSTIPPHLAGKTVASGRASTRGAAVSTTRCFSAVTARDPPGDVDREPETCRQ
jgi:hypothetical protein